MRVENIVLDKDSNYSIPDNKTPRQASCIPCAVQDFSTFLQGFCSSKNKWNFTFWKAHESHSNYLEEPIIAEHPLQLFVIKSDGHVWFLWMSKHYNILYMLIITCRCSSRKLHIKINQPRLLWYCWKHSVFVWIQKTNSIKILFRLYDSSRGFCNSLKS